MNRVILLFLLSISFNAFANDSIYLSLTSSKCKLVNAGTRSTTHICSGPKGHTFEILDNGGIQIAFNIKYQNNIMRVYTNKEPKVIEYRIDDEGNVIGVIIRIYTFNHAENFTPENTSSKLYVYSFSDGIKLIGKVLQNEKARALLD